MKLQKRDCGKWVSRRWKRPRLILPWITSADRTMTHRNVVKTKQLFVSVLPVACSTVYRLHRSLQSVISSCTWNDQTCSLKHSINPKGKEARGVRGNERSLSGVERPLYFMGDLTRLQESNFALKWHIAFLLY